MSLIKSACSQVGLELAPQVVHEYLDLYITLSIYVLDVLNAQHLNQYLVHSILRKVEVMAQQHLV